MRLFVVLHFAFGIAADIFFADRRAFVVRLFALAETDQHFHKTAFEIHFQWQQGITALMHFAAQAIDFLVFEQKIAWPERVVVHDIALLIGFDAAVNELHCIVANQHVTVRNIDLFLAERFNLGACERNTGLKIFDDFVVKAGLAVDCDFHGG